MINLLIDNSIKKSIIIYYIMTDFLNIDVPVANGQTTPYGGTLYPWMRVLAGAGQSEFSGIRMRGAIYDKNGEYSVRVYTKRLIDFKERKISSSDTFYSLETFIAIASINQMIMQDDFFNELFYKNHDDKIYINTETITFKE